MQSAVPDFPDPSLKNKQQPRGPAPHPAHFGQKHRGQTAPPVKQPGKRLAFGQLSVRVLVPSGPARSGQPGSRI
jgi:hypothetical protein